MKSYQILCVCALGFVAGFGCEETSFTLGMLPVASASDDELEGTQEFPLDSIRAGRADYMAATLRSEYGRSVDSLSELEVRSILLEVVRGPNNVYLMPLFDYLDLGLTVPPSGSWQNVDGHSLTSLYVQHGMRIADLDDPIGRLLRIAGVDTRLDTPDRDGLRAIDHAVSRGFWEVVVMLQAIGAKPPDWKFVNVGRLDQAILRSDIDDVHHLLRRPIDPSARFLPWREYDSVATRIDWLIQESGPRDVASVAFLRETKRLIEARAIPPDQWRSDVVRLRANDKPWKTDFQPVPESAIPMGRYPPAPTHRGP